MKFFSYSPDVGFDLHDTAEKAKQSAIDSIEEYRFRADDGWDDDVENVCWGEVRQESVAREKGTTVRFGTVDVCHDYELEDVDPPNPDA